MRNLNCGKEWHKIGVTVVVSKKLFIEKNHPIGENSPNLVTLLLSNVKKLGR
jgi:hypothetical protein